MTTLNKTPGNLHLTMAQGDDLSFGVDFGVDKTGYSYAGQVHLSDGTSVNLAIDEAELASGRIVVSLTDEQSTAIAVGWHRWCLVETSPSPDLLKRTVLGGTFKVTDCSGEISS